MAWAIGGNGGGRWKGQDLAGEESRACLLCSPWRLQREGKQQKDPGPSIPASCCQPNFLGLWLHVVLFAEHNAHGADACNGVEWIFKSSFALQVISCYSRIAVLSVMFSY